MYQDYQECQDFQEGCTRMYQDYQECQDFQEGCTRMYQDYQECQDFQEGCTRMYQDVPGFSGGMYQDVPGLSGMLRGCSIDFLVIIGQNAGTDFEKEVDSGS